VTTPTHLAFLWHMHQPWYIDPATGEAQLPWVRLHGVGAYSDMLSLLESHPTIRTCTSFSPSLLDQLARYVSGAADRYEQATLIPAEDLGDDDRTFLLRQFFSVHWGRIVQASPRYSELLEKRGRDVPGSQWKQVASTFSTQELRDLQVLFNLSWFGASTRDADLDALVARGGDYREADKQIVLDRQREVLARLMPRWRQLAQTDTLEIVSTPYHHPILPLLIDTNIARRANPEVTLPERFAFAEDARLHVDRATRRLEQEFGGQIHGLWPAEAAISPEVLQLARQAGLRYLVTDAQILFHSLDVRGSTPGRGRLYQSYSMDDVALFFRDDQLSRRVAQEYCQWEDCEAAARDFVEQVRRAGARARVDGDAPPLVLVALDGENPWEAYPNRGNDFLAAMFHLLENDTEIRTVTLGQHLEQHPPTVKLDYLNSGSWIEANFDIWIGDAEKNRAWNLLSRARHKLARDQIGASLEPGQLEQALEHLLRAECSDWFWWLGEPFSSAEDMTYEGLFRSHLLAMYHTLGESPPADLSRPIASGGIVKPLRQPTTMIQPRIDGTRTSYFEWRGAGFYQVVGPGLRNGAAMGLINGVYWGFDAGRIFLRLDPSDQHAKSQDLAALQIHFELTAPGRSIVGRIDAGQPSRVHLTSSAGNGQEDLGTVEEVVVKEVVELAIPIGRIGFTQGDRLGLSVHVEWSGQRLQDIPHRGVIELEIPDDDFED